MPTDEQLRDDAAVRLRAAGLRVTAPRVGVLVALERESHADADTVARHVRGSLGAVSTQAVYDVLHALTEAGLLRRIEPAGSAARYETRVGDNHHHMICRGCGVIADVDCSGAAPCLAPEHTHGFVLDEAEVTFWGLCPACQSANEENA
ncbi:Fur family transcriptional regulator [Jiangella sp. DSM 45060]|uniref:Fur family transcriptional regulator n=1 Tax=Jiangella sp. DSM 45060 TaxID=1798224 RepID=UPI0008798688|nr:Fur family transcriptional regulator [Jiangella sp. DSM 45060]SDR97089.1 Fur family transcriptional regulator, ferric uptake regulator [Jiangella sp. DSM 45060]